MLSEDLPKLVVMAGPTGSGKTLLLEHFCLKGYPVIHLEELAGHKGSVFGHFGYHQPQPSQQDFEANLQSLFNRYQNFPFILTEHEAPAIGKRRIPAWFYDYMQEGLIIYLQLPKSERIKIISEEYGQTAPQAMCDAVDKLSERLSADTINQLKALLLQNKFSAFADKILDYYDQSNHYKILNEKAVFHLHFEEFNADQICLVILKQLQNSGLSIS